MDAVVRRGMSPCERWPSLTWLRGFRGLLLLVLDDPVRRRVGARVGASWEYGGRAVYSGPQRCCVMRNGMSTSDRRENTGRALTDSR